MERRLGRFALALLVMACVALGASQASALTISWTDWTVAQYGFPGSASGQITMGDGSVVGVSYRGEVTWAQTSGGTYWWTEGTPAPYTGNAVVDNAPATSDILTVSRAGITNTLSFSQAVDDPVMAFVSIGQPGLGVNYAFDTPNFTLLSEGQGWWGNGSWSQSGSTLTGFEAHGVIQFSGSYTSISWVNTPAEYWHGFTVGAPNQASVPEPSTLLLLGSGLVGLAALRRRRTVL